MRYALPLVVVLQIMIACDGSGNMTREEPALPRGSIHVTSAPVGARIYLDNSNSGQITPVTLTEVDTGFHEIRLSLSGFVDDSAVVHVSDELTSEANFALLTPPVGKLFINSSPAGASIFLDGTSSGKVTPDSLAGVLAGIRAIKLAKSGYFDTIFTAAVLANQRTDLDIQMRVIPKVPVVIQNIFDNHCIGCHSGSSPPQGQNLSEDFAYRHIVNITSNENALLKRIKPGDPDNSYLVRKIEGSGITGERMPFGGPYLTQAQIDTIRTWVTNGALPR